MCRARSRRVLARSPGLFPGARHRSARSTLRTAADAIAALVAARCSCRRQRLADTLALGCIVLLLLDPLSVLGAGFIRLSPAWPGCWGARRADQGCGAGRWCTASSRHRRWPRSGCCRDGDAVRAGLFAGPLANVAAVPWWSLVVIPLALLAAPGFDSLHAGLGAWLWQAAAWAFDQLWPVLARIADSPLAMAWLPEARWYVAAGLVVGVLGDAAAWRAGQIAGPAAVAALAVSVTRLAEAGRGGTGGDRRGAGALRYWCAPPVTACCGDMGPATEDGLDAGERAVVPALHALGIRDLDAAMLSHGDNDHAGGWLAVDKAFPVAALLAPAGSPAPGIANCVAGQSWEWDGVRFRVLHPTPGFPIPQRGQLRAAHRNRARQRTADRRYRPLRGTRDAAAATPTGCAPEAVIVLHHGMPESSDAGFIAATHARLAVVSSGAGNRFGHPKPQVVRR